MTRTAETGSVPPSGAGPGHETALELAEVHKTYPAPIPVHCLRGVSLTLRRGEMTAVVGPSGSGKSTLMHLAAGLDRPTAGRVRIGGTDLHGLGDAALAGLRAHRIGVVFQQFFLMERLTAAQNVAAGLLYRGLPGADRLAAAAEALDRVGLGHRREHPARDLSGGERQRVAIARAVVGAPALVLADEPTGNLDTATGRQIMALLDELNRQGVTILVITHDREIAAAAPRRIELRDGLIVRDTGPQPPADPLLPAPMSTAPPSIAPSPGPVTATIPDPDPARTQETR